MGGVIDEIGTPDFLNAFFATISKNLEPNGWGSRFPALLNSLYQGRLSKENVRQAQGELAVIRAELREFPPENIVWDYSHPEKEPPWGKNISGDIVDLSEYFITSTGRDVFDVINDCLEDALKYGEQVTIESTGTFPGVASVSWGSRG